MTSIITQVSPEKKMRKIATRIKGNEDKVVNTLREDTNPYQNNDYLFKPSNHNYAS